MHDQELFHELRQLGLGALLEGAARRVGGLIRRSRAMGQPGDFGTQHLLGLVDLLAGKFLEVEGETLYLRGVTYGTFRPDPDTGDEYDRSRVRDDFAAMANEPRVGGRKGQTMARGRKAPALMAPNNDNVTCEFQVSCCMILRGYVQ